MASVWLTTLTLYKIHYFRILKHKIHYIYFKRDKKFIFYLDKYQIHWVERFVINISFYKINKDIKSLVTTRPGVQQCQARGLVFYFWLGSIQGTGFGN